MNEDPTIPIGELGQTIQATCGPSSATTTSWGSFSLLARVGHGGFGEVYRAWDPHLQREVALKLLLPGAVTGEAEYEAMLREARALASVRHPNIVPVHGIDRHDGRVGFWTDFVRGKTLSVLVREQGTFGAREAALIGLDVARALSAVHRAGLLHRDIKAENVMREEGGRILLMDFGLSVLEQRQTNLAGTPNYMAPELFQAGKGTIATDIYAMGVLLYFLVAGDYPVHLHGLAIDEALEAFSKRKPLMDLRPDLPEPLLRTVATATEMDPARRFQSAGQLANALAESLGTHVPSDVSVAPAPPANRRASKWIVAGLAAALVLAGSLIGYRMLSNRAPDKATATPPASAESLDQFQKAQDLLLHSYKDSNLAEAVKGFQAVLAADPGNALAEADLGAAHFIQYKRSNDDKLLELATQETHAALAKGPELAAPYITLSRIAAFQGKTDAAMQYAQKALKKEKDADAYGALGEVYEAQKNFDEAVNAYKKAIDFAPNDWRWPMSLGAAEFDRAKPEETLKQFQKAIELAPDNPVAYYDLGLVHLEVGKLDEARGDLENSIHIAPTDQAYSALGSVLLIDGKYAQAADSYRKAIKLSPRNYETYYNLGNAYERAGDKPAEAHQAYAECMKLAEAEQKHRPKDPLLAVILAYIYAQLGQTEKSEQSLRHALALDPDEPRIRYIAGETYEAMGKRDDAIPDIAFALAQGYRSYELERNPRLASLRSDPKFAAALNEAKSKKK